MNLANIEVLRAQVTLMREKRTSDQLRREHELAMSSQRNQWHTALIIMVIAGVWLVGDLVGLLLGAIDGGFAGALANPGFAALAGVGGYKLSQNVHRR